jgi:hypothetical protein
VPEGDPRPGRSNAPRGDGLPLGVSDVRGERVRGERELVGVREPRGVGEPRGLGGGCCDACDVCDVCDACDTLRYDEVVPGWGCSEITAVRGLNPDVLAFDCARELEL